MKFDRLIDAFMTRNMRCPLCSKKFTQLGKNLPIGKKSAHLGVSEPTQAVMSLVNDSVRFSFSKEQDVWHEQKFYIHCKNNRHEYKMFCHFEMNTYRGKTQKYTLSYESFRFTDHGKSYDLFLDWQLERSIIKRPNVFGAPEINRPGILKVTNRQDIIEKIDRLFNMD